MSATAASPSDPAESARLMRLATVASLAVALTLVLAKAAAWAASDAVTLLASLVDSALDAVASLANLLAVRQALTPADREHRFGHGKAEALSGLAQAVFISGSAVFLVFEAVQRLQQPVAPAAWAPGVAVMLFSIALTAGLLLFQRHVIRRSGSTAIRADALHYRADLLVNISVIVALLLATHGWAGFDALFALAIALYIAYSAWDIIRQALAHLMDRELPDAQRERIRQIVSSSPNVRGLHDLRTRRSGINTFIQLHLELDDQLSLLEAHRISDQVAERLGQAFPGAELIIHADPESVVPYEPPPDYDNPPPAT